MGPVHNSIYCGRVYDLQDLTHPLATVYCPDPYPGVWRLLSATRLGGPRLFGNCLCSRRDVRLLTSPSTTLWQRNTRPPP